MGASNPFVYWDVELPESLPLGDPAFSAAIAEAYAGPLSTA